MSQMDIYPGKTNVREAFPLAPDAQTGMTWTISSNAETTSYSRQNSPFAYYALTSSVVDTFPVFETVPFFDNRADDITVSLYERLLLFAQAWEYIKLTSSLQQTTPPQEDQKDDPIDMHPRASKKIVMRASYKGRGKPRIMLDPLP